MKKENFNHSVLMLLFIGVLLTIVSCSTEPQNQSYINIGDQYELKIHQQLSPEGGLPSIVLKTLEKQNCLNSYISNHAVFSDGKTQIFINEILVEGECISGNEYIDEEININSNNEMHNLELIVQDVIHNYGTIQSTEKEFDLNLTNFDGLKIVKTHIYKIQPQMFWGSYSLNNVEIAEQLIQYLNDVDLNSEFNHGDYGWFYVDTQEKVTIYESDYDFTFLISTQEDFEKITTKLLEFKELDSSLVFQATNFHGRIINID